MKMLLLDNNGQVIAFYEAPSIGDALLIDVPWQEIDEFTEPYPSGGIG